MSWKIGNRKNQTKYIPCLKETKQIQSKLLASIFKKPLEESALPNSWKKTKVTAIFKNGERKPAEISGP